MAYTSGSVRLTDGSGYTAGVVQTDRGRHPYALHWHAPGRMRSVVDVHTYRRTRTGTCLGSVGCSCARSGGRRSRPTYPVSIRWLGC